jgi:hypothetical protein
MGLEIRYKVNLNSFHGHEFVFKDGSEGGHGRLLHKVAVDKDQGRWQYFKITDMSVKFCSRMEL